jgi:hypothetical protein
VSLKSLMGEKRRFVQRWPERSYRYRPDTIEVSCHPDGRSCIVQSLFDFTASNPARHLHSRGVSRHELVIGFGEDRPAILTETSKVLSQKRVPIHLLHGVRLGRSPGAISWFAGLKSPSICAPSEKPWERLWLCEISAA